MASNHNRRRTNSFGSKVFFGVIAAAFMANFFSFSFFSTLIPLIIIGYFVTGVIHENSDLSNWKTKTSRASDQKWTKMNRNLKAYFKNKDRINLTNEISIRPIDDNNSRKQILQVYYNEENICRLDEFKRHFPTTYNDMIDTIYDTTLAYSDNGTTSTVEEVKKTSNAAPTEKVSTPKKKVEPKVVEINAAYFIEIIDNLNIDIVKEEITNDLYETTAMLKHISKIEEKYPDSKDKLSKLYQYYLPILVGILENYVKLVNSNATHEENDKIEIKLIKTIILVNEALKTITMQLCDDEIIDLKSDMSVLETILRKDGLVKDGTMQASKERE